MKASAIDTEIQKIDAEIATRKRRTVGLPSSTPPASEANLLGSGKL